MKITCNNCNEKLILTNKIKYKPICPHCRVELDLNKCISLAQQAVLRSLIRSGVVGDLNTMKG